MILHPGILALLFGSAITLLMLLYAAIIGAQIVFRWDYHSSSAYQLRLERKTYLVSTLVSYAFGFQIAAAVLFIFTMDDIHRLFVGAMCATGSFNANPVGWYVLFIKILVFFLSGFWISLNSIDGRVEEYPFVKLKYCLLFGILPFIGVDFFLQLNYFLGLNPDIITSCCGSLFGGSGENTISTITTLPVLPTMILFFCFVVFLIVVMCLNLLFDSGIFRYLLTFSSTTFFFLAIVSIISFVSIYIYELPTHHCPFDILQKNYNFIGYPLYFTLFAGVYFGILPGLFYPLIKKSGLDKEMHNVEKRWIFLSITNIIFFTMIVIYMVLSSNLVVLKY